VYDKKEDVDLSEFPRGIEMHERAELLAVQKRCAEIEGVSSILYIQTCAAEKRRRRKRGTFPDIDKRVFINPDVCEGCGDCGVQSNCVSIVPLETELGRKRSIDQSSCNKDFSCVQGFCPSFVTLEGAKMRKAATGSVDLPDMPLPVLPQIEGTHNVVITGVGGTGVVTIGAILAMAAHLDGMGAGVMEMAGLAQKGGAVHIHCRLAKSPSDINAIRVATGEADTVIGGDLVTTAGAKTLGLMQTGKTGAVVNSHEIITGDFTRDTGFTLPTEQLGLALEARLQDRLQMFNASELAKHLLGDSIFSNMMMLGAAWQRGLVPLSYEAILEAVELNRAAVEGNKRAFEIGRWAALYPQEAARSSQAPVDLPKSLSQMVDFRAEHLTRYQGPALAAKYRARLADITQETVAEVVAKSYHKLLSYKDEYEVARLHLETQEKAQASFDGDFKMRFHLSPPIFAKTGSDGRPRKYEFGSWMRHGFRVLAGMKGLRGTPFDPFGRNSERRAERAMIVEYERDLDEVLPLYSAETSEAVLALLALPQDIRGYGPVKAENHAKAMKKREALWAQIRAGGTKTPRAAA
jgi:indolepyruvate ferredoxin oxidoreductase